MAVEGTVLAGRYRLGARLGEGGMSEVRRARDLRIGRWVAVKLLRPDLVRDPAFEGRFRREAQSAASLHSPGIVAVYDTGEAMVDGSLTPYIVMELVEGRTLRDVLAIDGRLPVHEALRVTAAICTALDEAHRSGIVHRDVKPGNVMLSPTGGVKVMDFGIARATASSVTMTETDAVVGTAHYLSPEQARGEHVDSRSDVYSTGCLLYELLTGSPPFTGDSSVAVAYQHVREDPVPPSRITADVSPDLDAVVLKALAKNPAQRYQSAGELREELQRVLDGRGVRAAPPVEAAALEAPPPAPTTVLVREPVNHRGRTAAYTLLGVATVLVFVVALLVARSLLGNGSNDLETPKVVGETLSDAQSVLDGVGLHVGAVTTRYSTRTSGIVIGQNPTHPILVRRGQAINLVVSRGIHQVNVPADIVGEQQSQAVAELKAVGLLPKVTKVHSKQPAGVVLTASPGAGQLIPINTTVVLSVSDAEQPVPGVVGMDSGSAAQRLQRAGFAVVERSAPGYQRQLPVGQVVSQTPAAGTYAPVNSTVQIFLNEPPAKPTKSSSPPTSGSPSNSASTSRGNH